LAIRHFYYISGKSEKMFFDNLFAIIARFGNTFHHSHSATVSLLRAFYLDDAWRTEFVSTS